MGNKGNGRKPVIRLWEKNPDRVVTYVDFLKIHIRETNEKQPKKSDNHTRKPFRQSRPQPIRNQSRGRENNDSRGSGPPQNQRGTTEPQRIERNWDKRTYRVTRPYQQQEQRNSDKRTYRVTRP